MSSYDVRIQQRLEEGPVKVAELAAVLGITPKKTERLLERYRETYPNTIRISAWSASSPCRVRAVWSLGSGPDAPHPGGSEKDRRHAGAMTLLKRLEPYPYFTTKLIHSKYEYQKNTLKVYMQYLLELRLIYVHVKHQTGTKGTPSIYGLGSGENAGQGLKPDLDKLFTYEDEDDRRQEASLKVFQNRVLMEDEATRKALLKKMKAISSPFNYLLATV